MAERETISPADAARVQSIIRELGLNTATTRYLGITARNVPRLERMAEGRAKVTAWEVDTIRLVASEREHVASLQAKNSARTPSKRLSEDHRDRAILDWLRAGKTKDGDQDPRARKQAIKALGALGFDPGKPMPYRRKAKGR